MIESDLVIRDQGPFELIECESRDLLVAVVLLLNCCSTFLDDIVIHTGESNADALISSGFHHFNGILLNI